MFGKTELRLSFMNVFVDKEGKYSTTYHIITGSNLPDRMRSITEGEANTWHADKKLICTSHAFHWA